MSNTIYIPSKGRAGNVKTLDALGTNDNVVLVVEPQDYKSYKEAHPDIKIIKIPRNDKGIAYVRNQILKNDNTWHWVLDDDISGFYFRQGTKMIKAPGNKILNRYAKNITTNENIVVAGFEYQQFAWSANKPYKYNTYCDVAVMINGKVANENKIAYDETLPLKVDRDFILQCLTKGFLSVRTTLFAFSAPKNGSNKGGLKEIAYDVGGKEESASKLMVAKWGTQICSMNYKNDGRPDVKIEWKLFKISQ